MIGLVVLKCIKACNLRCPYCYYINSDTEAYGKIISEQTLRTFYQSVKEHIGVEGRFEIVWHGGEPLLLGKRRFRHFLTIQSEYFAPGQIENVLQSNGVLIDDEWIDLFREFEVGFGISLDGPKHIHDEGRPLVSGEGSYDAAVSAIRLMQDRGYEVGVLAVVNPSADGAEVLQHFLDLGVSACDFLPPIGNNCDYAGDGIWSNGATAEGTRNYLLSAFRLWHEQARDTLTVELFDALYKNALGLPQFHLNAAGYTLEDNIILEPDGTICLDPDFYTIDRFTESNVYKLQFNVADQGFSLDQVADQLTRFCTDHNLAKLPSECTSCSMRSVCRGSHPASRYGDDGGFDHSSAYCPAMFDLSRFVVSSISSEGLATKLVDPDLRRLMCEKMKGPYDGEARTYEHSATA